MNEFFNSQTFILNHVNMFLNLVNNCFYIHEYFLEDTPTFIGERFFLTREQFFELRDFFFETFNPFFTSVNIFSKQILMLEEKNHVMEKSGSQLKKAFASILTKLVVFVEHINKFSWNRRISFRLKILFVY